MGKSKSGGTRGYIRGRIANDVYSIGKDGKGKKQQVIRSLAESVANPRTTAQMRGRMYMSTVMQAVSALSMLVDHSFDGVPVGQPSLSAFIKANYALVKADAIAHPSSNNEFGLVKYGQKGITFGEYQLSDGKAVIPAAVSANQTNGWMEIYIDADTPKVGDIKSQGGLGDGNYLTFVSLNGAGGIEFFRVSLKDGLDDTTAISSENVESLFDIEGNCVATVSYSSGAIKFAVPTNANCNGVIYSVKNNGSYEHSKSFLVLKSGVAANYTADVALPTYPTGTEQFLNGGEI